MASLCVFALMHKWSRRCCFFVGLYRDKFSNWEHSINNGKMHKEREGSFFFCCKASKTGLEKAADPKKEGISCKKI